MTDLPKRELGRIGLQVTMLGYGAMELRGAFPRPPNDRGTGRNHPQRRAGRRHQLHRHLHRRRRKRRTNQGQTSRPAIATLGKLDDLLGDMTPMEFILRFTFTNPDLDTTIVGTANPAHLQANVEILKQGPLPADLAAEAKRRLTRRISAARDIGNLERVEGIEPS